MHSGTDVFGIKANLIPRSDTAGRKLLTTILANHAKVPDHGKNLSVLSAAARLWSSLSEAPKAEAGETEATGDDAEEADKADQTEARGDAKADKADAADAADEADEADTADKADKADSAKGEF